MARCEHDAVMAGANNEMMFLNIKALNEWDSKVSGVRFFRAALYSSMDAFFFLHRNDLHNIFDAALEVINPTRASGEQKLHLCLFLGLS